MPVALQLTLAGLVAIAGIYDWRFRKIPNWLSLSGLVLGLGMNSLFFGFQGLGSALLGACAALLIYVPLYYLRAMGAGDVKLMVAVGALAGPGNWLAIFAVTAVAGGLISLLVVLLKRRLFHTMLNLSVLSSELLHFRRPALVSPELDVKNAAALRVPHALPIAFGCLLVLTLLR